ncbi:MAG: hypothetical protein CVT92_07255 [Bacteroidetes bacterium HGW-Bacteroidetes-1]|jgi:hypothetical protein|nr:MAG: hypothetical protein CVT92_07255 [Bacteroidetes bacterium HGW-Bacteroidetes-1]
MKSILPIIKKTPVLKNLADIWSKIKLTNDSFPGSSAYWEKRYAKGGTSGDGSYNRLAIYKAETINSFVKENSIQSIIEFGCGDGNQLSLARYPKYIGIDVSPTIIQKCTERFKDDASKSFFLHDTALLQSNSDAFLSELSLSLDVVFHLVEENVFIEHMNNLFLYASKFVIIYSSNFNMEQTYHEKDRKFTDWVETHQKNWKLKQKIPNKYSFDPKDPDNTSKSDFYIFEHSGNN